MFPTPDTACPPRETQLFSFRQMVKDWQITKKGEEYLVGLAIEGAVLDVLTTREKLGTCLDLLRRNASPSGDWMSIGSFGEFPITIYIDAERNVSLFVDGPQCAQGRNQSFAIWVDRASLAEVIEKALGGEQVKASDR